MGPRVLAGDASVFSGGGYVNMIMDEGEDRVKAASGDNYARLAQAKAKYDPQNQLMRSDPGHIRRRWS